MSGSGKHEADKRRDAWIRRLARANALLVTGSLLNIVVVAFGVRDVLSWPFAAAIGFATFLIALQFALGRSVSGNGLLHGVACASLYGFVIAVNLVLAVSGIVAIAAPDSLGRRSFEAVVAAPRAGIVSVADNLASSETALATLAGVSEERARTEAERGSSCGPSGVGMGPKYRLRMRDRDRFAQLASAFSSRAAAMRQTREALDAEIASYSVAYHTDAASRIGRLVERARQSASDPAISSMRAELRGRLEGVRGGVSDPDTGVVVMCPDEELAQALAGVLEVAPPAVPMPDAMPQAPSHRAAAMAFVREVIGWWRGAPFDSAMWGAPVVLGFFPDAVFLVGLMQLKRSRRERLGVSGILAKHLTSKDGGWNDAAAAARAAADDPRVEWLLRFHSRKSSWYGHSDFLTVPAVVELEAFLQCVGLVQIGRARYAGRGPAKQLIEGAFPRPIDGEVDSHFFVLRRKVWERLLVEAMQEPCSSRGRPDDDFLRGESPEMLEAAE